jgi:hypothetical protein
LEAIVSVVSYTDVKLQVRGHPVGEPLFEPSYFIDEKKSVREAEHAEVLWEWYRLATGLHGEMARIRLKRAVEGTAPIVKDVAAQRGAKGELITRYRAAVDNLTQRAAREEVDEELRVGLGAERGRGERQPEAEGATDDEKIETLAERAREVALELVEASHKISERYTTHEASQEVNERLKEVNKRLAEDYDNQLRGYMTKVFKEGDVFAEPPEPRSAPGPPPVARMSFADGMAFVKGGLDVVSAILAVKDPKARRELFKQHSTFFGTVAGDAEITKVLFQFVSGGLAFYGGSAYGMAKIAGKSELAEQALDLTVHRVGQVAGALYLIGAIHGIAVLLDPEATSRKKAEAAVETVSSTVALTGFASRWMPRLAAVADWSGPVAASLSINFAVFNWVADRGEEARRGLNRLDWVPCFKATQQAALTVQKGVERLAVADALLAFEHDEPRKGALLGVKNEFVERQLKPYFLARFSAKTAQEDRNSCGPGLKTRLRPVVPLVDEASRSNRAALDAGAAFLETIAKAFSEWDQIVNAKADEGPKAEHFAGRWQHGDSGFVGGRRGVVVRNVGNVEPGVVHMRHDADVAAGAEASILPDEPYFKAYLVSTPEWSTELIPGQVVRALITQDGGLSVALDSLYTRVLPVTNEEKHQADKLLNSG